MKLYIITGDFRKRRNLGTDVLQHRTVPVVTPNPVEVAGVAAFPRIAEGLELSFLGGSLLRSKDVLEAADSFWRAMSRLHPSLDLRGPTAFWQFWGLGIPGLWGKTLSPSNASKILWSGAYIARKKVRIPWGICKAKKTTHFEPSHLQSFPTSYG